ncbi:MAG TPA: hypothetical protein VE954_20785 [Oligoflexus sp.]|uniref:hypothetical protein n=1 Tax=Oligoflexus sp. TaxID=1971216 RepID=UPI002D5A1CEA|nr:hypothetical protein [Oligoflexus sp.]HYX35540.1 hypothetical protein [Oligoflexus sp.]
MNFLRKILFGLLLLSSAAQSQVDPLTVEFEGNFVSTGSATGTGIKIYYGSRPTVTVDLVTNDLYWQFAEGKDVRVSGLWTQSSDGDMRLIAKDVQPMSFRKGTLESAFGIGGESTGYQLRMANGLKIEIDLQSYGLTGEFALDRSVEVRGYFKVIQAVQTRRVVLVVNQVKPAL